MKRLIIVVIIVVVFVGGFFAYRRFAGQQARAESLGNLQTEVAQRGPLTATVGATGIVRSDQRATLVWETSGTVERVNVEVGDRVEAGEVLASLKDTSLPQNVILARADLVGAQRELDDLLVSSLQRAQALQNVEDAKQALEDLLNPELQQAQALEEIANAEKAVEDLERRLNILRSTADQADIDAARAQVILARDNLEKAQEDFEPYQDKPEDNLIRANLLARLSAAQQAYDAAVRNLNALQSTGNPTEIAVAEADLATARASLVEAVRNYERVKDGPRPADVALAEARLEDAKRELERLEDGPDPADITAVKARIDAAQAAIEQAKIIAPFGGIVTEVTVKPGDQVAPSAVAFRVDDLSRLLVDVDVSEVDINRIDVGQEVTLSFDAVLDKEYQGEVVEVGLVGTTVQGVVSFNVTVALRDPDQDVRPGMTAGVNVVVNQLEDVLLIPNRAVRIREGNRVVFVLGEGNPVMEPVRVELGASSDAYSQVLSGDLQVGDRIVLNPPADFGSFFEGGPPGDQ